MALSERQLQDRRSGIGASDAITIMWGTSEDWRKLYNEKVNDVRPEFDERRRFLMDMGHAIEPLTLAWFNEKYPLRELPAEYNVRWSVDPFFRYTPDGITIDGGLPVQCKFPTGDKSILDLADFYGPQLLHEMLCSKVKKCYLAVTFGHYGRQQHLEVEQDEEAVETYLKRASAFKEYIATGVEPDWMEQPVNLNIPRRRDHVWETSDNEIAALSMAVLESFPHKVRFEEALEELKDRVPNDAASATWRNAEGTGIQFKVARNNSKRWIPLGPAAAEPPPPTKTTLDLKKRKPRSGKDPG